MKKQWDQFPFVLRRKILLTALAGLASLAVSLVIFAATTDSSGIGRNYFHRFAGAERKPVEHCRPWPV